MKKLFNSFLILFLTAGSAWAADPEYEIGSGSIMSSPPAIGAVAPNTGKFTHLEATMDFKVVGHSSLDSADFVGNVHTSNASTATFDGPVIINGALNYVGAVQGSLDNVNIGQVAPGKGKFTTLEATGGITGALTGNASTSTALAGNPTDCSANNFATAIDAGGNLTCAQVTASGISGSLTQNTSGTAANVTGTVAIANGGTGATTQQGAINALAGAQTSGQYLRGNGTNISMSAIQAGDVPTLNQNTTGNAATATALASNPTDCSAGQFARAIDASGNLTCAAGGGGAPKIVQSTRDLTAANATISYTGAGFAPSNVIIFASEGGAAHMSIGMADATNQNSTTADTTVSWYSQTGKAIVLVDAGGSSAGVVTLTADGCDIAWTKTGTPSGTTQLYFMFFR